MFREQVDAAELHARVDGSPIRPLAPPTVDQVEDVRVLERQVLTTVFSRPGPMSVSVQSDPAGAASASEVPSLGTVPLRLTLPDDLAAFWCDLEILHADEGTASCAPTSEDAARGVRPLDGKSVGDTSFVAFLVASTLATARGMTRLPAYGDIYLRDRFRCQSPTCHSRNCTPHHIVFRSHGGGEEPSNLVSLCNTCHLDLVHDHHLTVTGHAPNALTWSARAYHISPP